MEVIKLGIGTGLNVVREFNVFERVKAIAHHSKAAEKQVDELDALMNEVQPLRGRTHLALLRTDNRTCDH